MPSVPLATALMLLLVYSGPALAWGSEGHSIVAEIAEPPHCGDGGDKGGDTIHVSFMGQRTNLHAVWDTRILAPAVAGDERAYALRLVRAIKPDDMARWRGGSPAEWANECYGV